MLIIVGLSISSASAQDVVWKKHFGGKAYDVFFSVIAVADGVIALGYSEQGSFNNGDWVGIVAKGSYLRYDAIIVKYDNNGAVIWKKNFGGSGNDYFTSAVEVADGVIVTGYSHPDSFNTGDWAGITGKGDHDAFIVKYNHNGDVVWKKHFGGNGSDRFESITAVSDGVIVVGQSSANSFGSGDWSDITGNGSTEAIIVKYDYNGNMVWKKHFGGSGQDFFLSIITVADGVITVGYSQAASFGNGDWTGVAGNGNTDATIVKYDNSGTVVWKKTFGGSGIDQFSSVTAVNDGLVAVGYSAAGSFGNGKWEDITGKGGQDAIIVKYDHNGDVVWKNNFGGNDNDVFYSVTAIADSVVAVGVSWGNSFNTGDWAGITGNGSTDAIIVKYDHNGDEIGKKNFGGRGNDRYNTVTAVADGVIAAGFSGADSFGYGNWAGITGNGDTEAIIVKYNIPMPPFITITTLPDGITETAYTATLAATGTAPVVWSIENGNLPNGLSLNATTGEISGTPVTAETVSFTVKATNAVGSDIQELSITITYSVGIATIEANALQIYPNPANDVLNFSLETSYKITDLQGRILQKSDKAVKSANISSLSVGIYFVTLTTEIGKSVKKIIKE